MPPDYGTLIEPVKNKRTFEEVSDRLKELIFNGTLRPGEQLPSEVALAQLFKVGRQSVREALRILELSGFITVRPGVKGGAVIEGTLLSKISGLFLEACKLNRISVEDCMAARMIIEPAILELVLKKATKADIQTLRDNVAAAREKVNAGKPAFNEHILFHRLLAGTSGNYTFSVVVEIILAVFADFIGRHGLLTLKESQQVINLHEGIIDAVAAKKKTKAIELLKADLTVTEKGMRKKIVPPDSTA
jgi:GntR family transcriptional regulator, transcriptional repressor for pyruvate dehydrogenase complex